MALEPCRECGQQVSTEAAACPHCGTRDPTGKVKQKLQQQQKRATKGCLMVGGGLFIFLAIIWVLSALGLFLDRGETGAYAACQDFVKERLGLSWIGKFPGGTYGINVRGSGKYEVYHVQGYVDAQNAFGAQVRTDFTCNVHPKGSDWQLVSLDMND